MYTYICGYIYIYIYIHTYVYICVYIFTYSCMCACVNVCVSCMRIYIHSCICTHIYKHTNAYTDTTSRYPICWLRPIGSLKVQVSFTKEMYKKDNILQKKPIILRSLLVAAIP